MTGLRPISILAILQVGFIALGYLATELCITVFYGRHGAVYPVIVGYATGYWWAFMAVTVLWAALSVVAQVKSERRIFSTYLPCGTGLVLLLFTFAFYVSAALVAAMGPPLRLTE